MLKIIVIISIVTFILLKPIVAVIFPNHLPGVLFVYLVLPGLIFTSLREPLGLVLNSAVILKPMLYVNATELLFDIIGIIVMITGGFFSLTNVAILRTLSGALSLVGYVVAIFIIRKRLFIALR